ncbi:MAG: cell division protein ZapA [Elusimicrobiota bacterium]
MLNEKVDVVIAGRKFTIEMEGLSQLEISSIAQLVNDRMERIKEEQKVVDSSKLAIMTALEIAAELQKLKSKMEDFDAVEQKKVDKMLVSLTKVLGDE